VFYESLRALPGLELTRNERPLDRLTSGEGTTLFVLGTNEGFVPDKTRDAVENFVRTGGRLVLTLFPRYDEPPRKQRSPSPSPSPRASDDAAATGAGITLAELLKRWNLDRKADRDDEDNIATRKTTLPLEKNVSWHSGVAFTPLHSEWRTIYEAARGPVMVERNFDAGTVVVASDSFFVSNEALLAERAPALLAWLAGPQRRIIFDESHLNVREDPGVATLLRRYGLSGFVIGLLVLIALWLWRNATFALAPRRAIVPNDELVSGRDSFTGFVHLIRRGIAPNQLVDLCVAGVEEIRRLRADEARTKNSPARATIPSPPTTTSARACAPRNGKQPQSVKLHARPRAHRDREGDHRPGGGHRPRVDGDLHQPACADRRRPGHRENAARPHARARPRQRVQPHPVHARPDAG
jgi:hypothetical protein